MTIRLDQKNSKIIGGKVFITAMKAHKLNQRVSQFVSTNSKINHPQLGIMYEYSGQYTRKQ